MIRRGLVTFTAAVLLAGLPAGPAAAATSTIKVGTAVEAWYHTTPATAGPACDLPTGCGLPAPLEPANPYPEGTLHVAFSIGQESARTYVTLRTEKVPQDHLILGGTLRVPVAGPDAGTLNAEGAAMVACFTPVGLDAPGKGEPPVQGSFESPPIVDCDAGRSPAVFVPAAGDVGPLFTIDLAPFAEVLGAFPDGALALIADPDGAPTPPNPEAPAPPEPAPPSAWHVATHGKASTAEGVRRVGAELLVLPPGEDPPPPPPFDPGPLFPQAPPPAPTFSPTPSPSPTPAATSPVAFAPLPAPGYAYPVIWVVPIALLLLAGALGRVLTRPITPPGETSSA